MSEIIDKNFFLNAISESDNAYQKFSNNHIPTYREFYVESRDDAEFYRYYLAKMYNVPKLIKIYGCKKEGVLNEYKKAGVLNEYRNYNGKKAGFIVDLDYLPLDRAKYKGVITTSGYSMENFFFYCEKNYFNLYSIFRMFYQNYNTRIKKIKKYIDDLIRFKQSNLLYYAYFKTHMEVFHKFKHLSLEELKNSKDFTRENIKKEINEMPENIKIVFNEKYNKNIELIDGADFMLIRGHDIFDHLVDFLRNDGKNVKVTMILQLAYEMNMPRDFMNQISLGNINASNEE